MQSKHYFLVYMKYANLTQIPSEKKKTEKTFQWFLKLRNLEKGFQNMKNFYKKGKLQANLAHE